MRPTPKPAATSRPTERQSPGPKCEGRPAANGTPTKSLRCDSPDSTASDDNHGALLAADALPWFNRMAWDNAIRAAAASGLPFSADELQERQGLPDVEAGAGGLFMSAHRAGVIRRVGYRPSTKASRSGGVVAIWVGTERGAQ